MIRVQDLAMLTEDSEAFLSRIPQTCGICKTPLVISPGLLSLRCGNPRCTAVVSARIHRFVRVLGCNVSGEVVLSLVRGDGGVESFYDFFSLMQSPVKPLWVAECDRLLVERGLSLAEVLVFGGYPGLGGFVSGLLVDGFGDDVEWFVESFEQEGFGFVLERVGGGVLSDVVLGAWGGLLGFDSDIENNLSNVELYLNTTLLHEDKQEIGR